MKLLHFLTLLLVIWGVSCEDTWSWDSEDTNKTSLVTQPSKSHEVVEEKSQKLNISSDSEIDSRLNVTGEARFLGIGDKLCSLGLGANCKKTYPPAVDSHYGAPPPPKPASSSIISDALCTLGIGKKCQKKVYPPAVQSHYGAPSVATSSNIYQPPVYAPHTDSSYAYYEYDHHADHTTDAKQGYPPTLMVAPKPLHPVKGILNTIGDAVSSLFKKPSSKPAYEAPRPVYNVPNPVYTAPNPIYSAPNPVYGAPKPIYTAPKPVYAAPKPIYAAPKPTYAAPKPIYTAPKPVYAAPKPVYTAPKPIYTTSGGNYVNKPIHKHPSQSIHHVQAQPVVQHLHSHTHIYEGHNPNGAHINRAGDTLNPFSKTPGVYQHSKVSDVVVQSGSQNRPHIQPAVLVGQKSFRVYQEDCQCVLHNFCQASNVVARSSRDISHLLDARNDNTDIFSTANNTETLTERVRRDIPESNNTTDSDVQGRQLKGFTPGLAGCGAGHVCCRRPVYTPQRSGSTCGKSSSSGILGRVKTPHYEQGDTEFGQYPWQAAILKRGGSQNTFVCGAALIDDHHVMTAAHCVEGLNAYEINIRLGEWDVAQENEFYKHVDIQALSIYMHKDYNKGNLQNDIAVVRLTRSVDFINNPHISPICLPSNHVFVHRHQECHVTGWGKDTFSSAGRFQAVLKEVAVPLVDHYQCQNALRTTRLGRSFNLEQGMLCAGGEEGRDACTGDGGSPLVCRGGDGTFQLVGLVSWGIGCGEPGIPGVYVKVDQYLEWIRAVQQQP